MNKHFIQEYLTNIKKHANAKNVRVALFTTPYVMQIEIMNDQIGFTKRVAKIGTRQRLGEGCVLCIRIPLRNGLKVGENKNSI